MENSFLALLRIVLWSYCFPVVGRNGVRVPAAAGAENGQAYIIAFFKLIGNGAR